MINVKNIKLYVRWLLKNNLCVEHQPLSNQKFKLYVLNEIVKNNLNERVTYNDQIIFYMFNTVVNPIGLYTYNLYPYNFNKWYKEQRENKLKRILNGNT